jgi:hypothetical protein
MKVKCISIFNEHTMKYQSESEWLTVNKEYIVLSIDVYADKVFYLIVDDSTNNIPGLHNAAQFQITSNKMPKNWTLTPGEIELFTLGPKAWQLPGFWESFYEGNLLSLNVYQREAYIIYEESEKE